MFFIYETVDIFTAVPCTAFTKLKWINTISFHFQVNDLSLPHFVLEQTKRKNLQLQQTHNFYCDL